MTELPNDNATEEQKKIIAAIDNRGAVLPCPKCNGGTCWPANGYVNMFLSPNPGDIRQSTGHRIVAAALICNNCGYISFHDISRL